MENTTRYETIEEYAEKKYLSINDVYEFDNESDFENFCFEKLVDRKEDKNNWTEKEIQNEKKEYDYIITKKGEVFANKAMC